MFGSARATAKGNRAVDSEFRHLHDFIAKATTPLAIPHGNAGALIHQNVHASALSPSNAAG